MDELELELMIMDFEEEFEEYQKNKPVDSRPIWWQKLNGLCENVTEQEYKQAKAIHSEFKAFCQIENNKDLSTEELFLRFEQFKIHNRSIKSE